MASPPDQALSRAITTAIRALRAQGWTTREIADKLGVADPTISRWENGKRLPALDLLPKIDALCGERRGYVLRVAGYVEDGYTDVRTAIMGDTRLTDEARRLLLDVYEAALRRAIA